MFKIEQHKSSTQQPLLKNMPFSTRERQCVELFLKRFSNIKAAESLGITIRTLHFYLKNIKHKTGYRTKKELIKELRNHKN